MRQINHLLLTWFVLVGVGVPVPAVLAAEEKDPPVGTFLDQWFAVRIKGHKHGHAHTVFERIERPSGDVIRSTQTTHLEIPRAGSSLILDQKEVSEETLDGKPLAFESRMNLGGQATTIKGRIEDGKVHVVMSQFNIERTATYDLPENALMTWGAALVQEEHGFEPGTTYTLGMYMPSNDLDSVMPMKISVEDKETIDLFGRKVEAIRLKETMKLSSFLGKSTEMESTSWLDKDGNLLKTSTQILSWPIEILSCPKPAALADNDPSELMLDTLIRIDQSISPASTEVTYRFKRKTEDSKLDLSNLPSTGMQQVIKSSEDSATVKVVVSSAARQSAAEPLSDDMRKRYLAASSLVNYEDPEIQELAKRAAGDEKDPARLANKLCDFVADYIEDKNLSVGFASASEVARSKEGDCTEHGILLAALGRAHGIPTRLVTGIVYVNHFGHHRDVFVGHLWAQFWLEGRWVDLDAALDENPVKPTHIALSLSDAQDTALVDMVSSIWLHLNQFDLSVVDQKSGSASQPAASKPADR